MASWVMVACDSAGVCGAGLAAAGLGAWAGVGTAVEIGVTAGEGPEGVATAGDDA